MKILKSGNTIRKIVFTALFASLVFVGSVAVHIHVPVPTIAGCVTLGDCIVLVGGILLGPLYGGLAAGLGSAMADLMYEHLVYVPASFVIKMLMAVAAYGVYRVLSKDVHSYGSVPLCIAAVAGELVMVGGYLLYETVLFSFGAALAGLFAHILQGCIGALLAVIILKLLKKTKLVDMIKIK